MDLTFGFSGAGRLRHALGRPVLAFPDSLVLGPVRGFSPQSAAGWIRRRSSFWDGLEPQPSAATEKFTLAYGQVVRRLVRSKATTLWTATDVDGLLLCGWVTSLHDQSSTDCQLELLQFPRSAGPAIGAMPDEVIGLPLRAVPVVGKTRSFFAALWEAWSAPDPRLLLQLFGRSSRYRSRRALLSALLDRYPQERSGLTRWELALLESVGKHGPSLASVAAHAISDSHQSLEDVGDLWLLATLRNLARAKPKALLAIEASDAQRPFAGSVGLTELGASVSSGRASVVETFHRREWVGGVRLGPGEPLWLRTAHGLREVRSATR